MRRKCAKTLAPTLDHNECDWLGCIYTCMVYKVYNIHSVGVEGCDGGVCDGGGCDGGVCDGGGCDEVSISHRLPSN